MTIGSGIAVASTIATDHEKYVAGAALERSMDLRNNNIGRDIGKAKGACAASQVKDKCHNRAKAKTLWRISGGKFVYGA